MGARTAEVSRGAVPWPIHFGERGDMRAPCGHVFVKGRHGLDRSDDWYGIWAPDCIDCIGLRRPGERKAPHRANMNGKKQRF